MNSKNGPKSIAGGCQCGAVRYLITGPLGDASICHCRMCQKAFGSFVAPLVPVLLPHFAWTKGTPGTFRSSSIVDRGFCRDCGTPLYLREDGAHDIEIAIGTLDDPNAIAGLARQSGVESRVHWFAGIESLPEQTTTDYRSAEDMEKLRSLQHPDHD